ncbi:hypothetical protein LBMAG46_03030 [Planctomycetia bacterium]|nr:hypothetical protein LBMAG46_03030 [Planctomycetia bacterium]
MWLAVAVNRSPKPGEKVWKPISACCQNEVGNLSDAEQCDEDPEARNDLPGRLPAAAMHGYGAAVCLVLRHGGRTAGFRNAARCSD